MALCGSSFRVSLHWQLLSRNYKASNRQVLPRIESRNLFVWSVVSLNVLVRRELSWNQKLLDQYRSMYWIISHTIKCIKSAEIAEQNKLNAHLYSHLANTVFLVNSVFFYLLDSQYMRQTYLPTFRHTLAALFVCTAA